MSNNFGKEVPNQFPSASRSLAAIWTATPPPVRFKQDAHASVGAQLAVEHTFDPFERTRQYTYLFAVTKLAAWGRAQLLLFGANGANERVRQQGRRSSAGQQIRDAWCGSDAQQVV